MKNIAADRRRGWWMKWAGVGITLGLALVYGSWAWAEVEGPVVGFARLEVGIGSQWVTPTVQPFAPQADAGETKAQVLTEYLGEEFVSAADVNDADWIGCGSTADGSGGVSMMWRDPQGQWRDSTGNAVDSACAGASGFWVDLVFDAGEWTGAQTRELVLSGEAVWEEEI
jgi:hypothetical protein